MSASRPKKMDPANWRRENSVKRYPLCSIPALELINYGKGGGGGELAHMDRDIYADAEASKRIIIPSGTCQVFSAPPSTQFKANTVTRFGNDMHTFVGHHCGSCLCREGRTSLPFANTAQCTGVLQLLQRLLLYCCDRCCHSRYNYRDVTLTAVASLCRGDAVRYRRKGDAQEGAKCRDGKGNEKKRRK
ncbi:hypothetical protein POVWA2_031510 [Plasmodium ovale wallikeri]|uniref:Uncharacterized protein n=1 Tax=Plasmodium ovale wallikeri TaxID=864142 RepID=A0A1A8YZ30_PLAOA|nr:hypothetical protein POVWA1_031790 [Plasmodium ovale wallikeri]SBT36710.1 hypothetical protein POVWA2_031510 [Plasmodium ovale wallikeri]